MNLSTESPSGNANAASIPVEESGNVKAGKRGRRRNVPNVQSNTMIRYMTKEPATADKRSREERGYDSSDEEMDCVENKREKISTSPNDKEMALYNKLAKVMHKNGQLDPIIAEAALAERTRLVNVMKKEGRYYKETRERLLDGKKIATKPEYELDCAVFEATKWQIGNRLDTINQIRKDPLSGVNDFRDLMTKAVTHVSPDTSVTDSSVDTSIDTNAGTDSSRDTVKGSDSDDSDDSVNSVVEAVMKKNGIE